MGLHATAFDRARCRETASAPTPISVLARKALITFSLIGLLLRPSESTAEIKLNDTLGANSDVETFAISPDGTRVVYRADRDTQFTYELYSVPIGGGTVIELNAPLAPGGFVADFTIDLTSSHVVYRANQDDVGKFELYSVPITGGVVTKLNGFITSGGSLKSFSISPDGSRVIYRADQITSGVEELFSVPIGGGVADILNDDLGLNGDVRANFEIDSTSTNVVYRADRTTDEIDELFSVPIGDGPVTDLTDSLISGGEVMEFLITPSGLKAVYGDAEDQVNSVNLTGSSHELIYNAGSGTLLDFRSTDTRVVIRSDENDDGDAELHGLSINGGTVVPLDNTPAARHVWGDYAISSDTTTVVFNAFQESTGHDQLWSTSILGVGNPTLLSDPSTIVGGFISSFEIAATSAHVVYLVGGIGTDELYSVPIGGGTVTKLNAPLAGGGDVFSFAISPDGLRVVYRADQDSDGVVEVYSVPITGGTTTKQNGPLAGNVFSFAQSSADTTVVYRADQTTLGQAELFAKGPGQAIVYVDFAATLNGTGTIADPFNVLSDAVNLVQDNGTIIISTSSSSETIVIDRPITFESQGGAVQIGIPSVRSTNRNSALWGFVSPTADEK